MVCTENDVISCSFWLDNGTWNWKALSLRTDRLICGVGRSPNDCASSIRRAIETLKDELA